MVVAVLWVVLWLPSTSNAQGQAGPADLPIAAPTRMQVIETILSRLNESYVLPEVAAQWKNLFARECRKASTTKSTAVRCWLKH